MYSLFLFKNLSKEEIDVIVQKFANVVDYKKGETICCYGDYIDSMGYINSGEAVAIAPDSGVIMTNFKAHDIFGVASLFSDDKTAVTTILAKTACCVIYLKQTELENIFREYPATATNYISFLSEKIRFLNSKISIYSSSDTEQTVLKYLHTISGEDGKCREIKNMTGLSKMLGIGRASLYRAFESLEKKGLIIKTKNLIRVVNYEKNN